MEINPSKCIFLVTFVLALTVSVCFAGNQDSVFVTLSPRTVTDTSKANVRTVFELWNNYLNSRPDSLYDNPYWSLEERRKLKNFDVTGSFLYRDSKYFLKLWKPCVLSIDSVANGYMIQTAYIECDTSHLDQSLWAVQNVLAKRESGIWRLFNSLPREAEKLCTEKKLGRFKFIYSKDHHFNENLARKTVAFADSLSAMFSIPLHDTLEFYVADNISDLTELMGMPFCLSMSTGVTFGDDGKIFTASGLEFYPHELTHLVFGKCGTSFASEGIATWQGGASFKDGSLKVSIQNTMDLLHRGSEIPLDSLISTPWQFRSTMLFYVTAGMVAALVYDAEGAQGISKLQKATEGELQATIENILGIHNLTVGKIWDRYSLRNSSGNEAKDK